MSGGVAYYDQGHRTPSKEQKAAYEKLNEEKFDSRRIGYFLCAFHDKPDLQFIDPFEKHPVQGWQVLSENVLGAELTGQFQYHVDPAKRDNAEAQAKELVLGQGTLMMDPQPKNPFKHPVTGKPMESDLDQVCIYSISTRRYAHDFPISIAPRLNYYPRAMSELQDAKETDEIFGAAKSAKGGFTLLQPSGGKDQDLSSVPMPELQFAYQNRFFVRTWAMINETNIRNGLVPIPPNVCQEARLPLGSTCKIEVPKELWLEQLKFKKIADQKSPEAQEIRREMDEKYRQEIMEQYPDAKPIEFWYAVPINHVLAWGYASEDYTAERNHKAYKFKFTPPAPSGGGGGADPVVLYFIVPNTLIEANIKSAMENMIGKTDKQNIRNVGFQFLPHPSPKEMPPKAMDCHGTMKLRTYVSYYSGPKLQPGTIANLAPCLCPGFPSPHQWSDEEQNKLQAIREYQNQTGKTVRGLKK